MIVDANEGRSGSSMTRELFSNVLLELQRFSVTSVRAMRHAIAVHMCEQMIHSDDMHAKYANEVRSSHLSWITR